MRAHPSQPGVRARRSTTVRLDGHEVRLLRARLDRRPHDPSLSIPRQLGACENAIRPSGGEVIAHYWDIESGRARSCGWSRVMMRLAMIATFSW